MFKVPDNWYNSGWHIGFLESVKEGGYDNPPAIRIIKDDGKEYSFYSTIILDSLVVLTKR